MNAIVQAVAVSYVNLKSLPSRFASSVVVVIGIAGVVGVLVAVMAMSSGLENALLSSGRDDRVIVMRAGANFEGASSLTQADVIRIMTAPGLAVRHGDPLASAELMLSVNLPRADDGEKAGVVVRGLAPAGLGLRNELALVEGRMFEPGLRELIVGVKARAEFSSLNIGDEVVLRDGSWRIVGVFDAGSTAIESALVTDASTLQSAYQRNVFNSVRAQLQSPDTYDIYADALTTDPSLTVDVIREPEHFARAAENLEPLFFAITNVVGTIMALGALFAALNTMYSSVSSRTTEIATLRAIGFGSAGVVTSVLIESLTLALVGALVGAGIAMALFNGNTISIGGDGGSLVADMNVTAGVLGAGIAWACGVGALGGLFPAVRAARLPVATAIREA